MDSNNTLFVKSDSTLWLEQRFFERVRRNPAYSLRSFAKFLQISPSYLSRVFKGERQLSLRVALQIAISLRLSQDEQNEFLKLVEKDRLSRVKHKDTIEKEVDKQLSVDAFAIIAQWYHYGIMQLFYIDGFRSDEQWIAEYLNISVDEVKMAIERLLRVGVLKRNKSGGLERTYSTLSTTTDVRADGLRYFHKQILEKAIISLEVDDIKKRDITSITMAVNEEQLPKAKEEIRKFRKKISKLLETGKKTQVYNLGVHLVPISNSTEV